MGLKVIKDVVPNAWELLGELMEFADITFDMLTQTLPYKSLHEKIPLPTYVVNTRMNLEKLLIKDFSIRFPRISRLVVDSNNSDVSMMRIHDACYKFGNIQRELKASNCVLSDDTKREKASSVLRDVVADIIIYTIMQFRLYIDEDSIYESVREAELKLNITKDVMYGNMLSTLKKCKRSWYAYEPLSPMYQHFVEMDESFVGECEENLYPVTDAIAEKMIYGKVSINVVRTKMLEKIKDSVEMDVDVTPSTLISNMNLN